MANAQAITLVLDVAMETRIEDGDHALAESVLQCGLEMQRADLPSGISAVYISLVLTDDAGIAALNRKFRGVAAPTDVLSFPQYDALDTTTPLAIDAPLLLGDIVVSLPRAAEQAQRYGHSRSRELGFLLVHGLLHLLGYDHDCAADAARMEARQEAVLHTLGLRRDGQTQG